MVYSYLGLSKDTKDARFKLNSILSFPESTTGEMELFMEADARLLQLRKLMSEVSAGDTVQIYSICDLGITARGAGDVLIEIIRKDVNVVSVADGRISPNLVVFFQIVLESYDGVDRASNHSHIH